MQGSLRDSSEQVLVSEILSRYTPPSKDSALKAFSENTAYDDRLTLYHFALFLFAEGAFVLTALREFMQ